MTQESLAPLSARFRRVESISPIELRQMHELFTGFYENADLGTFLRDLSEKSGVIMVREKSEAATIRGFSTIKQVELDDNGRPAIGVFSGDTILHPDYWGDRALKDGFVRYMLGVKARMPRTPIYWLLISKGYKTYLLLANNFVTYYPRHDKRSDPRLASIVDQYCQQLFPLAYDRARGVLDFGDGYQCLRDPVAPIDDAMRAENPAIAFFEERNPEWQRGVELPCVGEVSLNLLWPYLAKESSRMRSSAPPPGPLGAELGERMPSLAELARQITGRDVARDGSRSSRRSSAPPPPLTASTPPSAPHMSVLPPPPSPEAHDSASPLGALTRASLLSTLPPPSLDTLTSAASLAALAPAATLSTLPPPPSVTAAEQHT